MNIPAASALSAALLLTACANTGTPMPADSWREAGAVPAFEASGRMGIQEHERGSHAHFDWLRTAQVQLFEVKTPLGGSVGYLCEDGSGVTAASADGSIHRASSTAELSRQLLGYDLPVAHLDRWANGLRVPDEPYSTEADGSLRQMGWHIRRRLNEDGRVRLLHLERTGLSLRLVFDRFGLPENPPSACPQPEAS